MVIKTRWVLTPEGEGVKATFVMKRFTSGKTRTMISMQEHQLRCRSIWFGLWQQNVTHHKQLRVSMFPQRFLMRR